MIFPSFLVAITRPNRSADISIVLLAGIGSDAYNGITISKFKTKIIVSHHGHSHNFGSHQAVSRGYVELYFI